MNAEIKVCDPAEQYIKEVRPYMNRCGINVDDPIIKQFLGQFEDVDKFRDFCYMTDFQNDAINSPHYHRLPLDGQRIVDRVLYAMWMLFINHIPPLSEILKKKNAAL